MKLKTNIHSGVVWYKVQENDNLGMIAQAAYGMNATPQDTLGIYQANAGTIGIDPCKLPVGASLLIPDKTAAQPSPQPYYPPYQPPFPGPIPTPKPPKPKPIKPAPVGACTENWGNGVCLFKTCPYPPFTLPCD